MQAGELARILIDRFGAHRVLLFGSVARGESVGRLSTSRPRNAAPMRRTL